MAKLGQQVDVYCGRCKVERYHTVAAIGDGGRIERVVCGYCQSARKYKDPSFTKPAATRSSTGVRRTKREEEPPDPGTPARPYTPHEHYEKGDFLFHAKYGRGRVTDVRGDRIDVRFSTSEIRTFLHAAS